MYFVIYTIFVVHENILMTTKEVHGYKCRTYS